MTNPTGETNGGVLRLDFDRQLMLQFGETSRSVQNCTLGRSLKVPAAENLPVTLPPAGPNAPASRSRSRGFHSIRPRGKLGDATRFAQN